MNADVDNHRNLSLTRRSTFMTASPYVLITITKQMSLYAPLLTAGNPLKDPALSRMRATSTTLTI